MRRSLSKYTTNRVIGKFERFFHDAKFLADRCRQTRDRQQAITFVVGVVLTCTIVELGKQTPNCVALKLSAALWTFGPLAVADFIDSRQMPAEL
jgi:hypothetical protein